MAPFCHFGLISAASWAGVPIAKILEHAEPLRGASRVRVSGFDRHAMPSFRSEPGASWIFTREELESSGAFLATAMNGRALTSDHGRPVRLVVPGRYGCACIKWVDEIAFVDDDAPATGQMREFASRTHQDGLPALARDYQPAKIDLAAMPIRVEAWRADGRVICRVCRDPLGGRRTTDALVIRFDSDSEYVPSSTATIGPTPPGRCGRTPGGPARRDAMRSSSRSPTPASGPDVSIGAITYAPWTWTGSDAVRAAGRRDDAEGARGCHRGPRRDASGGSVASPTATSYTGGTTPHRRPMSSMRRGPARGR